MFGEMRIAVTREGVAIAVIKVCRIDGAFSDDSDTFQTSGAFDVCCAYQKASSLLHSMRAYNLQLLLHPHRCHKTICFALSY